MSPEPDGFQSLAALENRRACDVHHLHHKGLAVSTPHPLFPGGNCMSQNFIHDRLPSRDFADSYVTPVRYSQFAVTQSAMALVNAALHHTSQDLNVSDAWTAVILLAIKAGPDFPGVPFRLEGKISAAAYCNSCAYDMFKSMARHNGYPVNFFFKVVADSVSPAALAEVAEMVASLREEKKRLADAGESGFLKKICEDAGCQSLQAFQRAYQDGHILIVRKSSFPASSSFGN
jgi:hypothetical protein